MTEQVYMVAFLWGGAMLIFYGGAGIICTISWMLEKSSREKFLPPFVAFLMAVLIASIDYLIER